MSVATNGGGRSPATRIVLAHGCFDMLHLGHIRHLQEARKLGDRLIVSVTPDEHVHKGPGRPHFTAEQRAEALSALECVDTVILTDEPDAVRTINDICPDVYVKGIDYSIGDEALEREIAAVTGLGGRFHITSSDKWSSSQLLNSQKFLPSTMQYLAEARDLGFRDKIHAAFERADELKIAFIGETILDEYRYVASLSKPSKEFVLATVEVEAPDRFLGGAHAAHLQGEWKNATVVSCNAEPIRKTRFVDKDFVRKLFEVYSARKLELTDEQRDAFHTKLIGAVRDCDVAVVLDFGHGLMDGRERMIAESAKFVAVNAQSNAGNYGFNPITKYIHSDLVVVDEPEARLATGKQFEDIHDVVKMVAPRCVVTRGAFGCIWREKDATVGRVPPFAHGGVDTMGAGDAYLAVAAPLVAAGLELPAAAFVGNVVGAIKVTILGHERHVTRGEILQTVDALLA